MSKRGGNMDTKTQNFWKEKIQTERIVNMKWQVKYGQQFLNNTKKVRKPLDKSMVEKQSMVPQRVLPTLSLLDPFKQREMEIGKRYPYFRPKDKSPEDSLEKLKMLWAKADPEKYGHFLEEPEVIESQEKRKLKKKSNIMRPVSASTQTLLYQGLAAEGEGAHAYLKERKKKAPNERFYHQITSTFDLGWVQPKHSAPQFGRQMLVETTFFRKNGAFD
eukprot:Nk52_evm38s230 gene=Nk52_evmTU38s230